MDAAWLLQYVYVCICMCNHESGSKQFQIWRMADRLTSSLSRQGNNKTELCGQYGLSFSRTKSF